MQWFNRSNAILVLLLIAFSTAFWTYGVTQSKFDYDFEKFFPPTDTETEFYEEYRSRFENDYDFLLIGLTNSPSIFQSKFLKKVDSLTAKLSTIQHVTEVHSITNIKLPVYAGGGVGYKKYVHLDNDSLLKVDSLRLNETGELNGSFISYDQATTCILLQTTERLSKLKSDQLLLEIENVISKSGITNYHLAGKIKAQQVYLSRMQQEIVLFLCIATVLVILFLAVTFRSFTSIVVSLGVVFVSIIWQLGIMHFSGKKIDVLLTLLPTILFIVGMSDVIHFLSKYLEELKSGITKKEAILRTIKKIGLATFLTSFTTAIGFLTLQTSNISPIREFGLYTAIGVMITFILSITLLPAVLLLLKPPIPVIRKSSGEKWNRILLKQFLWILKHRKYIVFTSIVVSILACFGMYQLKVNNLLLEDLREHEPLKQEFRFFENNFSGGRPFELYIEAAGSSKNVISYESIAELKLIESQATQSFQLGFVRSPIFLLKAFNRSLNSGLNHYYTLPETKAEYDALINTFKMSGALNEPDVQKIISPDLLSCRIHAKMHDLGSYKVNKMEKEFIQSLPPLKHLTYRVTGSARLIDKNISNLSRNLIQGLSIAVLIIAITIGLIHRSLKIMLISLIPNFIPMLCIAGLMGYLGIDIKVSTSLIFTIAFGIAVDDTIHFLSRFKIEQRSGLSTIYAIKRSFLSTGKAMILTSLILCSGFITMITSSFLSIFYLGLLLSTTLALALLADLYLLPILLLPLKKKKG